MQFARTASCLARLLRPRRAPTTLDIDLDALAPRAVPTRTEPATHVLSGGAPADASPDGAVANPWRTQPGVRYRL